MVITMGFYTLSHGKFHDRGYSDILYGINSIDIMGYCTPEDNHMVITLFYHPGWVYFLHFNSSKYDLYTRHQR